MSLTSRKHKEFSRSDSLFTWKKTKKPNSIQSKSNKTLIKSPKSSPNTPINIPIDKFPTPKYSPFLCLSLYFEYIYILYTAIYGTPGSKKQIQIKSAKEQQKEIALLNFKETNTPNKPILSLWFKAQKELLLGKQPQICIKNGIQLQLTNNNNKSRGRRFSHLNNMHGIYI